MLTFFWKGDEMNINNLKKYVIGFLLGFSIVFLLGAKTWIVDGHCQSTLSGVGLHGEVYLAITNTSTGKTIVHRLDKTDLDRDQEVTFDAESIVYSDPRIVNARR